jgi:hypothetical protein
VQVDLSLLEQLLTQPVTQHLPVFKVFGLMENLMVER